MNNFPSPPPSSSSFLINLTGGFFYLAAILMAHKFFPSLDPIFLLIIGLTSALAPILVGEIFILRVFKRSHLSLQPRGTIDRRRVRTKIAGFIFSIALVMAGYWLIPEYQKKSYDVAWVFFSICALPTLVLGCLYIEFMDRRMQNPHDGLWHFGSLVLGRLNDVDPQMVKEFLKSILLRGYFLPIMVLYSCTYIAQVSPGGFASIAATADFPLPDPHSSGYNIAKFFVGAWFVFASMDMLFGFIGYITVFRALDTHIRSIEPTFFGWFICLICYSPFWEAFFIPYLLHDLYKAPQWYNWFTNYPVLTSIWGVLVVSSMTCESLVTLTFGMRFSNLTYRGLISTGPYRLVRHPQYIAKAANRFFFLVPFLSLDGPVGASKRMLMFSIFCLIYFLRARTEENHLSRYPEYVEYAKWVDEYGGCRFIGRLFPFLKYSEERAKSGRLFS